MRHWLRIKLVEIVLQMHVLNQLYRVTAGTFRKAGVADTHEVRTGDAPCLFPC